MLLPSTLKFLRDLKANNNRPWFMDNKSRYEAAHANAIALADAVLAEMRKHDELENENGKKSMMRIYNDVRFKKDKSPYSPRFGFGMKRATKLRRGGYYVHIEPGASFMGCGFFGPNADDLKRIREDISANYEEWNKILKSKKLKDGMGVLHGDRVATSPRGYSVDHPAIELLQLKQYLFVHNFTDKEVLDPSFPKEVSARFRALRPWLDYMSEVLTTDANGETLV